MEINITPQQAHEWLSKDEAVIIDVREADEYEAVHIPSALFLPLGAVEDGFALLDIPEGRKIIFQCRSGKRSLRACSLIKNKLGGAAEHIYNMQDGILGWQAASLPVIVGTRTN